MTRTPARPRTKAPAPAAGTVDAELERLARAARDLAYAPYSNFRVGAALVAADGRIFVGANVENASYGLTVCAERNAVMAMVLGGAHDVKTIYVASDIAPAGVAVRDVPADAARVRHRSDRDAGGGGQPQGPPRQLDPGRADPARLHRRRARSAPPGGGDDDAPAAPAAPHQGAVAALRSPCPRAG